MENVGYHKLQTNDMMQISRRKRIENVLAPLSTWFSVERLWNNRSVIESSRS